MSKRLRFWMWWFGNRFLWVLIPTGITAYLLYAMVYSDARFLFYAVPESGEILEFGIHSEVIGGASVNGGSWQKMLHSPWISVESVSLRAPCRLEGQLGVFGDWLSDDRLVISQALEDITKNGRIGYYIEKKSQTCRASRAIDVYAAVIFCLSLFISMIFAFWSCHAIYNRECHEKKWS